MAQKVDARLAALGGCRFYARGEADDRTGNEEIEPWIAGLWTALGVVTNEAWSVVEESLENAAPQEFQVMSEAMSQAALSGAVGQGITTEVVAPHPQVTG